jgi:hypothetical protein
MLSGTSSFLVVLVVVVSLPVSIDMLFGLESIPFPQVVLGDSLSYALFFEAQSALERNFLPIVPPWPIVRTVEEAGWWCVKQNGVETLSLTVGFRQKDP